MDHRLRQKGSSVPLTTLALAASLSTALAVSGCVTHEPEETGEIRVAITLVPADVQCIRIFADGSRFVNQKFPVTPGMSSVIQMHGIPTGHVNFTADAFAETCDNVHDNTSTPTWSSDPVAADITANMVTTLTLTMHHNGNVNIVIDFGDDGTMCAGLGQVCMPTPTGASACCAGLTCNTATAQPTCMIAQMCIPDGAMCLGATIPCCDGGPCNANAVCGQMCRPLNAACAAGPDCCTGACIMGLCQPPNACVPDGVPCIATQPCCSGGTCNANGLCGPMACQTNGAPCDPIHVCCGGSSCVNNICQAGMCLPDGAACAPNAPCCTGCNAQGTCGPLPIVCSPSGAACMDANDCCSGTCVGLFGAGICQ